MSNDHDQETRVLRDEELDAVSGGILGLLLAAAGFEVGLFLGGSAVDGFVASATNAAKAKM